MYIVKNLTDHKKSTCDAVETIRADGDGYAPADPAIADGFNALVIVDSGTRYKSTAYAFAGHTLHGTEPVGAFESVPDPEPPLPPPQPSAEDTRDALLVDHELRITMLELGI